MKQLGESLQARYAAKSICFGCGPANEQGLHINSYPDKDDWVVCQWIPEPKYQAFPGFLYGGLIGSLLDCHCNWTAAFHLMKKNNLDDMPCTVTAEYTVKFLQATPIDKPLTLKARVTKSGARSATVEGGLYSDEQLCATCNAVFVAVKEGHPAYQRW